MATVLQSLPSKSHTSVCDHVPPMPPPSHHPPLEPKMFINNEWQNSESRTQGECSLGIIQDNRCVKFKKQTKQFRQPTWLSLLVQCGEDWMLQKEDVCWISLKTWWNETGQFLQPGPWQTVPVSFLHGFAEGHQNPLVLRRLG